MLTTMLIAPQGSWLGFECSSGCVSAILFMDFLCFVLLFSCPWCLSGLVSFSSGRRRADPLISLLIRHCFVCEAQGELTRRVSLAHLSMGY